MPAGAFANFHVYGPAVGSAIVSGSSSASLEAKTFVRAGQITAGQGAVARLKLTRLIDSPLVAGGVGAMVLAAPKMRQRMGMVVRVNALSQDDVTGAVLESPVEGDVTLREAMRLVLAYIAGNATGLDGSPAFRSLDGQKTRIAGSVSGGTRTVTTVDPS